MKAPGLDCLGFSVEYTMNAPCSAFADAAGSFRGFQKAPEDAIENQHGA